MYIYSRISHLIKWFRYVSLGSVLVCLMKWIGRRYIFVCADGARCRTKTQRNKRMVNNEILLGSKPHRNTTTKYNTDIQHRVDCVSDKYVYAFCRRGTDILRKGTLEHRDFTCLMHIWRECRIEVLEVGRTCCVETEGSQ